VVAELPASTAAERGALLKKEVEQLVVEAKKLGLDLDEVTDAVARHWIGSESAWRVISLAASIGGKETENLVRRLTSNVRLLSGERMSPIKLI